MLLTCRDKTFIMTLLQLSSASCYSCLAWDSRSGIFPWRCLLVRQHQLYSLSLDVKILTAYPFGTRDICFSFELVSSLERHPWLAHFQASLHMALALWMVLGASRGGLGSSYVWTKAPPSMITEAVPQILEGILTVGASIIAAFGKLLFCGRLLDILFLFHS